MTAATSLMPGGAGGPAEQRSVLSMVGRDPVPYLFFLIMFLVAIASGVNGQAAYASAVQMGHEAAVGAVAISYTIASAVAGVPAGTLVDRWGARASLLVSLAGFVATGAVLAALSWAQMLSLPVLIVITVLEGFCVSLLIPAIAGTQASLVVARAKGAAEVLNLLRMSLGVILGVVVASWIAATAPNYTLCLVIDVVTLASTAALLSARGGWHSRSTPGARPSRRPSLPDGVAATVALMREMPTFRTTVLIDLALRIVLPTKLTILFAVDYQLTHLIGPLTVAGLIGVLAANLMLIVRGLRSPLRRRLFASLVAYAAVLVAGIGVLVDDFAVRHILIAVVLLAAGAYFASYGQGLLNAVVQQRCPDEIRGTVTGSLGAARMACVALGVSIGTVTADRWNTETLCGVILVLLVVTLAVTRGFRGVGDVA